MKKILLCAVLIISLTFFGGCTEKEESNEKIENQSDIKTESTDIPPDIDYTITEVTVETVTEKKTYGTDEQTFFTVEYSYPKLSAKGADGIVAINVMLREEFMRFFSEVDGEISENEKAELLLSSSVLEPGKITHSYEIGFNTNNIFSLIETTSYNLHTKKGTEEKGHTFEIFGGKEMPVTSFIPLPQEEIDDMVRSFFAKQAAENPADYFDNADEILASESFSYQFYLNEKGVYIFLPYDYIAPHEFGRPNCFLSFRDISEIKK